MSKSILSQVKATLRSLIISSKEEMTVEKLKLDYRKLEGESIPFYKLGYRNIEDFLQSIPDAVQLIGSGPTAIVNFVPIGCVEHIYKNLIPFDKKKNSKVHKQNVHTTYQSGNRHHMNRTVQLTDKPLSSGNNNQVKASHSKPVKCSFETNTKEEIKRVPKPKNPPTKLSGKTINSVNSSNEINSKAKNPIVEKSFNEVCKSRSREINTFRDLTNATRPQKLIVDIEKQERSEEAVPSFAVRNVFLTDFPKNTVPYGSKIARYQLSDDITVGSCIKIFISEIHSPFKFWFHIHKEEDELGLLMSQIQRYYTTLSADDLCIPRKSLIPGQICAGFFNGLWHRAEIVSPPINGSIKVSFIDYGTVADISIDDIKFLASNYAHLPVQALRGCLSHIKPRLLNWTHDAALHFLHLTMGLLLYAKITEIDMEEQILYMIICNTHGDEIVQINKSLMAKRYALFDDEWKLKKLIK